MSNNLQAGWYYAQGDPAGTVRFWDGSQWQGGPQSEVTDDPEGSQNQRMASPWSRLAAVILDSIIIAVPAFIIGLVYAVNTPVFRIAGDGEDDSVPTSFWVLIFALTVIDFLYHFIFLKTSGATLGKKAVKIKVVRTDGSKLTVSQAFFRALLDTILYSISIIPFIGDYIYSGFIIINAVMIFVDRRRQILHDKFARTIVVESPR